jgi:hypothetical protein
MYLINYSLLPNGQQMFGSFLLPLALTSHWLKGFANCTPTSKEEKCEVHSLKHQQQANQLLSLVNYTPRQFLST